MSDELARIAAALDRLSPPPGAAADPLAHPAYVWRGNVLTAARIFAPLDVALFVGVDRQRDLLMRNMARLAARRPAHDVLLWGARGAGKSALVKAACAANAVGLIEVAADALGSLPGLFAQLDGVERSFAVFIDDLGFAEGMAAPRLLRSMLEGGAEARPDNVRLHVTTNHRNIVPREIGGDVASARDALDDTLALADRFGLRLGFHVCDQDTYVRMVAAYAGKLGFDWTPEEAIAFALERGGRSGRIAWQYAVERAGA
jgi:predicted AAA+ superfamily ATPase